MTIIKSPSMNSQRMSSNSSNDLATPPPSSHQQQQQLMKMYQIMVNFLKIKLQLHLII